MGTPKELGLPTGVKTIGLNTIGVKTVNAIGVKTVNQPMV